MCRFRTGLIAAAIITAFSITALDARAQQPQGRGNPGGGGQGRGGPGGGGPRGGPGGPGNPGGILGLALNPVVQEELKLKEAQKTKLQALTEEVNQRRQKIREEMFPQGQGGRGNRNNNNANANAQANNAGGQNGDPAGGGPGPGGGGPGGGGPGGGGPGGGGFGGFGGYGGWGMGPGGWGGAGLGYGGFGGWGMGPGGWDGFGQGGNGPGGGRGGRGQQDPEMAQRFAAMREAMDEIQQGSEQALTKILDRGQYNRLKQVQLQMEGVPALLRPDMTEKLGLDEEQVSQIQELINEGRQAMRENGQTWGEMMRTALPDQGNNGQDPNAAQNGQNGPNSQGRRRGPNFRDPAVQAAMKTFMEKPETKAKMEQMKAQNDKIQNQLVSAVYRVLNKRQVAAYKKMLGAPFDMAKLNGGPGQGPGNRNGANQANASPTAKKSQASDDEAATTKPAAKAKAPAAKSKRKSLRELRNLDDH